MILRLPERGFNSQPPEGGWKDAQGFANEFAEFQLTAARRRLGLNDIVGNPSPEVSTHSRPKAAGTK